LRAIAFSDLTDAQICRPEKNDVGRPTVERAAAIEFVLNFLDDRIEPVRWDTIRLAAEARAIASEATLNVVRAELAKSNQIIQVGKGRNAKWKLAKIKASPKQ
jgi:hypothetical protein